MAEQTRPVRRRFWVDPRLVIGVVLVAASVAGVVGIVSATDASVQLLTARQALSPGDRIDSDDLRVTSARLPGAGDLYLLAGDIPEEGLVVTKPVAAGELLPASAVGSVAALRLAPVVISVPGQLPAAIVPGATVDLWAARLVEASAFGPPSVIVSGATVVRVLESEAFVSSGDVTTLEVLVPRTRIARVLEALANEDSLSVVPVSLPVTS